MEQSEKIRVAEMSLARQLDWIRAVETKLAILVTLSLAMLGFLAKAVGDTTATDSDFVWLIIIGAVTPTVSLVCCALAAAPRLKHNNHSLIFFGTISSLTNDEYIKKFTAQNEPEYFEDLLHQVWRNAEIAKQKYGFTTIATRFLLFGSPAWLLAVVLLGVH